MQPSLEGALRSLTDELGGTGRVRLRPPAPGAPAALAERNDIGSALEQPVSRGRQVCVTSDPWTYLLAGLAVAADAPSLTPPAISLE